MKIDHVVPVAVVELEESLHFDLFWEKPEFVEALFEFRDVQFAVSVKVELLEDFLEPVDIAASKFHDVNLELLVDSGD